MLTVGTDSYISEADAATYLTTFGPSGAAVTEAQLRQATLAIERLYGGRFTGAKAESDQPLSFPRDGATDIPTNLEQATVEMALLIEAGTDAYAQPEPLIAKTKFKLDVIEEATDYTFGSAARPLYKIDLILAPLLYAPGGAIRFADVVRG